MTRAKFGEVFFVSSFPKYDVEHICSQYDPVSQVGTLLGSVKYVNFVKGMAAHKLGQLNKVLNGVELEVRY